VSLFRVTPRALRDLDAIADYSLAQWGEKQTEKYLDEIEQRFRWLAQNPNAGRARDEIGDGYRSYPQSAHVIFYIIDKPGIAIIGIPHASMDIDAYFEKLD
jgi:toxin ParE1/3/4